MTGEKEIPKGWALIKVQNIFDFTGGGTPSKNCPDYWNGDIHWASVKDIKGDYLTDTEDMITEIGAKNSATNIASPGDVILITRINPGRIITSKITTAINQDLKIIKPKFITHPDFIKYLFASIEKKCVKLSSGTTVLGLSLSNLNEIEILLPPLPEQYRIVTKIEELFSRLDKGIENLKTAQLQLKVYRQAVLKWAFEGRLTKENVKDGELPVQWKWRQIKEITSVLGDGLHGTPIYSDEGDYYFINGNNLSDGKIEIKENTKKIAFSEYEKYKKPLNENTIFVSIKRTIGNTAFYNNGKITLGKSACYFNVLSDIDKRYIRYCISSHRFINYAEIAATESTIKNVGLKAMREFMIPLPSNISEQKHIVSEIESRLSICDKIEETITQSLQQAEALRQSILKKAFEGKLVPQDPNDLPANAQNKFFVYVLECSIGSWYKGYTTDIIKRWKEHATGRGAEHTKKYPPVRLIHWEEFESEQEAINREQFFKTGEGREWLKLNEKLGKLRKAGEPASVLLARIKAERKSNTPTASNQNIHNKHINQG